VVEIQSWERVAVHDDVAHIVDTWLRGYPVAPESRWLDELGQVMKAREVSPGYESSLAMASQEPGDATPERTPSGVPSTRVFLFGVGRERVEQAADAIGLPVDVVNELRGADVVLTTKTHYRRGSQLVRVAENTGKPIYVLRKNTVPQVEQFLKVVAGERPIPGPDDDGGGLMDTALQEAHQAAQRVLNGEKSIELSPQRSYIRRLQHLLAERYHVASVSSGRDPNRRVTFYRA